MNTATDKIKVRAYELFVNRNGNGGDHLEDWLKAEKEIEGKSIVPAFEKNHSDKKFLKIPGQYAATKRSV